MVKSPEIMLYEDLSKKLAMLNLGEGKTGLAVFKYLKNYAGT